MVRAKLSLAFRLPRVGLVGEIRDRYLRLLEGELEEAKQLLGVLRKRHPPVDQRL
jgi:hypothetical protein